MFGDLDTVGGPDEKVVTCLCQEEMTLSPTRSIVVIWVKFFQTELMVKICSKSLVRAMGKVLTIKFS